MYSSTLTVVSSRLYLRLPHRRSIILLCSPSRSARCSDTPAGWHDPTRSDMHLCPLLPLVLPSLRRAPPTVPNCPPTCHRAPDNIGALRSTGLRNATPSVLHRHSSSRNPCRQNRMATQQQRCCRCRFRYAKERERERCRCWASRTSCCQLGPVKAALHRRIESGLWTYKSGTSDSRDGEYHARKLAARG
jgi:hypothetical protein